MLISIKTRTALFGLASIILLYSNKHVSAQQELVPIDESVRNSFELVRQDNRVQATLRYILDTEPFNIQEQFRITEIPAPPFKEERRAAYYLQKMQERGLPNAYIDSEGNVIGIREGTGDGPTFLIAAHLDTVFPEGVDTTVQLRGGRYYAPGIGDDTRGLAVLLSLVSALDQSGIETIGDIMFSGNVGEDDMVP